MSFKREGDDLSELNILKKRRVEELLSRDIPEDEAYLMKNGRFACLVCSHQPVLDTVEMLCVHRDGKRHKQCAEHFFRKKREFHQLVEKRRHELSLHGNSADSVKNTQAPLLMRTQVASQNALLRYAPYNPISYGAQSGQNSPREDFKTKRSKTKGFFEYTRNYLTNNVPAKDGRVASRIDPQSKEQLAPSTPDNSNQSMPKTNHIVFSSEDRIVSTSPIVNVTVRPYISKKRRNQDRAPGAIEDTQTSGTTFSVKGAVRYAGSRSSTDTNKQDEEEGEWEPISQFPPLGEKETFEVYLHTEGSSYESKSEGAVYDTLSSTSRPPTADKNYSRLNSVSGNNCIDGSSKSNTEGSICAGSPTSSSTSLQREYNRFNEDGICYDIEGSKLIRHQPNRFQSGNSLKSDNICQQVSSVKKVTHLQKDKCQRVLKSDQHGRISAEITNFMTVGKQSRKIEVDRSDLIQGSVLECDGGILQQNDLGKQSNPARQAEVKKTEDAQVGVNISSLKSNPTESNELKNKNQQQVRFKIGMSQKDRTSMNQRLTPEGESVSGSKSNVTKDFYLAEKRKVNPAPKPPKYSEERKRELEKHLELTSSGWVRDPSGRWVKDEDVEFDSDEEEPV